MHCSRGPLGHEPHCGSQLIDHVNCTILAMQFIDIMWMEGFLMVHTRAENVQFQQLMYAHILHSVSEEL